MNLTILDAYSVNPGDLSWESLEKLGNLTVYERTPSSEVVNRSKDSSIIFTNKTIITAEDISKLPQLKYIGILATGTNVVDLTAARNAGIIVTNIPAYSTRSVAQMTFALLLAVTNNVGYYTKMNREGHWSRSADFCYWTKPIIELAGKTIGIIGLGHIGMEVARIARAFGLSVLANTSKDQDCLPDFIKKADNLDDLLSNSDIVSLHCPLTDSTRHLINAETIKKMKSSAIIINTSRGPLVDEQALARALHDGQLRGAGLDVLATEPPTEDNPLLSAPNCYITPHIGWASREARKRLIEIATNNLVNFINGHPANVVD